MDSLIPTLALATLVVAVLAAVVGNVRFKRKPPNQHPMEKASEGAVAEVRTTDSR